MAEKDSGQSEPARKLASPALRHEHYVLQTLVLRCNDAILRTVGFTPMSSSKVFLFDLEIKVLPESDMYIEGAGTAFVYAFVPASSEIKATAKLKQELMSMHCQIRRGNSCWPYEGSTWENEKQQREFDGYAEDAAEFEMIVFSPFFTYMK